MRHARVCTSVLGAAAWLLLCLALQPHGVAAEVRVGVSLADQLPPLAHDGQAYSWSFLDETFTSTEGQELKYTASGLPSWAKFDANTHTITGMPRKSGSGDNTNTVRITAQERGGSKGQASSTFEMVTIREPAPRLTKSLHDQLPQAASMGQGNMLPGNVLHLPLGWSFSIGFSGNTFVLPEERKVYYSAYLAGARPLPSWLKFSDSEYTLSGVAPTNPGPTGAYYNVVLIGSNRPNAGGTTSNFTIFVAGNVVTPSAVLPPANVTSGQTLQYGLPQNTFLVDGRPPKDHHFNVQGAQGLPEWLSYDSGSQNLTGKAPFNASETNVTSMLAPVEISTDGTTPTTWNISVNVFPSPFTQEKLPDVSVERGKDFHTPIVKYLRDQQAEVNVEFSSQQHRRAVRVRGSHREMGLVSRAAAPTWLRYDPESKALTGTAPDSDQSVNVQLTAPVPIANAPVPPAATSFLLHVKQGATNTTGSPPPEEEHHGLSSGAKGAIGGAIGGTFLLCVLLALCCLLWRRRRSRKGYTTPPTTHEDWGAAGAPAAGDDTHTVELGEEPPVSAPHAGPQPWEPYPGVGAQPGPPPPPPPMPTEPPRGADPFADAAPPPRGTNPFAGGVVAGAAGLGAGLGAGAAAAAASGAKERDRRPPPPSATDEADEDQLAMDVPEWRRMDEGMAPTPFLSQSAWSRLPWERQRVPERDARSPSLRQSRVSPLTPQASRTANVQRYSSGEWTSVPIVEEEGPEPEPARAPEPELAPPAQTPSERGEPAPRTSPEAPEPRMDREEPAPAPAEELAAGAAAGTATAGLAEGTAVSRMPTTESKRAEQPRQSRFFSQLFSGLRGKSGPTTPAEAGTEPAPEPAEHGLGMQNVFAGSTSGSSDREGSEDNALPNIIYQRANQAVAGTEDAEGDLPESPESGVDRSSWEENLWYGEAPGERARSEEPVSGEEPLPRTSAGEAPALNLDVPTPSLGAAMLGAPISRATTLSRGASRRGAAPSSSDDHTSSSGMHTAQTHTHAAHSEAPSVYADADSEERGQPAPSGGAALGGAAASGGIAALGSPRGPTASPPAPAAPVPRSRAASPGEPGSPFEPDDSAKREVRKHQPLLQQVSAPVRPGSQYVEPELAGMFQDAEDDPATDPFAEREYPYGTVLGQQPREEPRAPAEQDDEMDSPMLRSLEDEYRSTEASIAQILQGGRVDVDDDDLTHGPERSGDVTATAPAAPPAPQAPSTATPLARAPSMASTAQPPRSATMDSINMAHSRSIAFDQARPPRLQLASCRPAERVTLPLLSSAASFPRQLIDAVTGGDMSRAHYTPQLHAPTRPDLHERWPSWLEWLTWDDATQTLQGTVPPGFAEHQRLPLQLPIHVLLTGDAAADGTRPAPLLVARILLSVLPPSQLRPPA